MPLMRYFLCVGGALLGLLFLADATLPKSPMEPAVAEANIPSPILRIHSDRKWPERIVYDTSSPALPPVMVANNSTAEARTAGSNGNMPATTAEARISQAFAELQAPDMVKSDLAKAESKVTPNRRLARAVTKKRTVPPMMLAAQRQQFGFISNSTW